MPCFSHVVPGCLCIKVGGEQFLECDINGSQSRLLSVAFIVITLHFKSGRTVLSDKKCKPGLAPSFDTKEGGGLSHLCAC